MKSLLALIIYGLLGCSLSISQASLYQESQLILRSLKQLDLQELMEVRVAEQAAKPDETSCEAEAILLSQHRHPATHGSEEHTQLVVACMPSQNNDLSSKQRVSESNATTEKN